MGQEVHTQVYQAADFQHFQQQLAVETKLLEQLITQGGCSERSPVAGFEIEAWLLDDAMQPAPCNAAYLSSFNNPLASAELAKFNIELNTPPVPLIGKALSQLNKDLLSTWRQAEQHARNMQLQLLMIGTLPTLSQDDLHLGNMSDMNRYRALNEQVLKTRNKPIHLDIVGREHLKADHYDVMLEAAATSFQLHLQCPLSLAVHYYNASILASAPMVAVCANAPFVFGKDLWQESRIPLFEQAVAAGGLGGAAQGPLWRVSFGSDFARHSIFECFAENLAHFPVLLPEYFATDPENFQYLRLHNGTIWRWNRPLVGFDDDGTPHIRIEHRTPSAGPTVIDAIANAAFFYGLCQNLCEQLQTQGLLIPFSQAKDNFYQAARYGLETHIVWLNDQKHRLPKLLENELLPRAALGLKSLHIDAADITLYLDIIRQRVASLQNGSTWQRRFMQKYPGDFAAMTRCYLDNQRRNRPIGEWNNP
ncbi:glutamate--cysteine ligase [Methylobacter svalbardensis]|uniref:glutamate--cysteine ligase n=1 Tax=Methylobacter svalbardensis TaxID=3080016 RepID=UPI0030ED66DF